MARKSRTVVEHFLYLPKFKGLSVVAANDTVRYKMAKKFILTKS